MDKTVIAFWILGLCNNFGYVIMLSAAYDLLSEPETRIVEKNGFNEKRNCHELSTGVILLADIIPTLFIKALSPFLPLWMNTRVIFLVITSMLGFIFVGISSSFGLIVTGVALTSFSAGLGESTYLAFTVFYKNKSIISAWSSGTGGAGFFGSLIYAGLLLIGVSTSATMYLMLTVPLLMAISFWVLLENPLTNQKLDSSELTENSLTIQEADNPESAEVTAMEREVPTNISKSSFADKLRIIPLCLKYIIPLSLVYFFEYLINQGLLELSLIENSFIDQQSQYRWYQVLYQIGVFISRSSINYYQIDKLWILALLQGVNVIYFMTESIFKYTPSVLIVFALILWEGFLGGGAYVNTYYLIQTKVKPEDRETVTGITSISDSIGISSAGFCAIPLHNGLCNNFGYVIMLSAAYDLLSKPVTTDDAHNEFNEKRHCNALSTGVILLADIIPALFIKALSPFLPLWMNTRVIFIILSSVLGFIFVGIASSFELVVAGVALVSFSSGLGESTYLSFTVFYKNKSIISAWSSGTGGAGFFGSLTYAFLTFIGLSASTTMYTMLVIPLLMGISFWVLLENPLSIRNLNSSEAAEMTDRENEVPVDISNSSFFDKLRISPICLKYIIPLSLVYYFEYLINQGLFELSLFENAFIDKNFQYRWYQVLYQIGVFISRSSVNYYQIDRIWVLAIFQGVNLIYFVTESIFKYTPSVYIVFVVILWEGFLGGGAYVNTYYSIQTKVKPENRETVTGITSISDSAGVSLAGFSAIPLHNAICKLPL